MAMTTAKRAALRCGGPRLAGVLLLHAMLVVPQAWADVRHVSKTGTDNPTCAAAAPCRSVQHAVNVASPGDTISIGQGKFVESFGVTIAKDLTIQGAGIFSTRVHGAWEGYSILKIESAATVTIAGLDVMSGVALHGGGIHNAGTLSLHAVRVRKNSARAGGGIFNSGTLWMSRTEVATNVAVDSGGGLHNQGLAVLDEVQVVANSSGGTGGGISTGGTPAADALALVAARSVIAHNDGAGIDNFGGMSLINSTVSLNSTVGIATGSGHRTELTHVTVADNGQGPGDGVIPHAGLRGLHGSEMVLTNTIVANNGGSQCHLGLGATVSATGSLVSDGSCGLWAGNLIGVDAKLAPLQWSKAGSTWTHALRRGSPAIDAGAAGSCAPVDQRGVLRVVDGNGDGIPNCDIGAFEFLPLKRGWPTEP